MNIDTNQANWTGKTIRVVVNQTTKKFKLHGYTFQLVKTFDASKESYPMINYDIVDTDSKQILGKVVHQINDPENKYHNEEFEAFERDIFEGNLSRYGKNIYDASIKMLCNII